MTYPGFQKYWRERQQQQREQREQQIPLRVPAPCPTGQGPSHPGQPS